jgi:hypothetical protein
MNYSLITKAPKIIANTISPTIISPTNTFDMQTNASERRPLQLSLSLWGNLRARSSLRNVVPLLAHRVISLLCGILSLSGKLRS